MDIEVATTHFGINRNTKLAGSLVNYQVSDIHIQLYVCYNCVIYTQRLFCMRPGIVSMRIASRKPLIIYIYIYTHARTHARTHAHTHARTHAHTHAHTYNY